MASFSGIEIIFYPDRRNFIILLIELLKKNMSKDRQDIKITVYTTSDFPSGIASENYVRQMTLGLYENGAGVRVVRLRGRTYGGDNHTKINSSNLIFRRKPTIELFKLFEMICIILFIPFSVTFEKLKHKTNAIFLYGIEYAYYNGPFLLISKILRVRIFRIVTDNYEAKSIAPAWWKKPKLIFYSLQIRFLDKYMDGLIVLSKFLQNRAMENKVVPERILLIPHFIDLSQSGPTEKDESCIRIGFSGSATIEKGFFDLIEAYLILHKKFSNSVLIITGKLPDKIVSDMEPLLIDLKNGIKLTGYLAQDELNQMLRSCDILVNPTRNSKRGQAAFPTKLGEYFATSNPVVSTRTGDIINYFTDKKELVLVEPDSPQSIVDGITFIISNKELAIDIGKNGFKWGKNNLDYRINAKKVLKFVKNN
jgi:glycosyltransferase involved in cell wall biosynthesis